MTPSNNHYTVFPSKHLYRLSFEAPKPVATASTVARGRSRVRIGRARRRRVRFPIASPISLARWIPGGSSRLAVPADMPDQGHGPDHPRPCQHGRGLGSGDLLDHTPLGRVGYGKGGDLGIGVLEAYRHGW